MAKSEKIIIPREGIASGKSQPRAIYSPLTSNVIGALGKTETQRASHVEPGSMLSQQALSILGLRFSERRFRRPGVRHVVIKPEFASHWFADMTPCGHDEILGPFPPDARDTALAKEVEWLHAHNIPVCKSCRTP